MTSGASSNLFAALVRTDIGGSRPHADLTDFLIEKPTRYGAVDVGLKIPGTTEKMGHTGVDTPPN